MTYERAKAILDTARANAKSIRIYKEKIEKCKAKLEAHQKLTAAYGTEHVSGGKAHNIIEDAVIKAEQDKVFYQQKLEPLLVVKDRADIIIHAMPKKWWKVARMYYLKGYEIWDICKRKHWTSKTSVYKQIYALDAYMRQYFKDSQE